MIGGKKKKPVKIAPAAQSGIWSSHELAVLSVLSSPGKIQNFLDEIPYSADPIYRCPRSVMRDRKAHCFDGALFAACALNRIGYPSLIIDMLVENDDDHMLAPFKIEGRWGAVAKSNFVGLRFREPIYRDLRELIMSYFEQFFNTAGEKTLRSYTVPINLFTIAKYDWLTDDTVMDLIEAKLNVRRSMQLLSAGMIKRLSPVDKRSFAAGMLGVNEAGLFQPKKEK